MRHYERKNDDGEREERHVNEGYPRISPQEVRADEELVALRCSSAQQVESEHECVYSVEGIQHRQTGWSSERLVIEGHPRGVDFCEGEHAHA